MEVVNLIRSQHGHPLFQMIRQQYEVIHAMFQGPGMEQPDVVLQNVEELAVQVDDLRDFAMNGHDAERLGLIFHYLQGLIDRLRAGLEQVVGPWEDDLFGDLLGP